MHRRDFIKTAASFLLLKYIKVPEIPFQSNAIDALTSSPFANDGTWADGKIWRTERAFKGTWHTCIVTELREKVYTADKEL